MNNKAIIRYSYKTPYESATGYSVIYVDSIPSSLVEAQNILNSRVACAGIPCQAHAVEAV